MKLIEVQAHGFKSFADKVTLKFDGGVVAIVGPNGSGKSNINDAIKWVLGESSYKALRGDNMEDVIFAGSETEKAMDTAEVTLTFDNSDRSVNIPHDIFTISRVLTRGKGSSYFINGKEALMKDIKEIAMQSGISKSSLAIISQGTISDVAEATPERRREFFEEAAGTSMYKTRKADAQRKLVKTEEALVHINSIANEMETQLKPLQRQAEKATVYLDKASQLKEVEIALLVHEMTEAKNTLKDIFETHGNSDEIIKDLDQRKQQKQAKVEAVSLHRVQLDTQINEYEKEIKRITDEMSDLKVRNEAANQRRELIKQGKLNVTSEEKIAENKAELNELNQTIGQLKSNKVAIEKHNDELGEKYTEIRLKLSEAKSKLDHHNDQKMRLSYNLQNLIETRDKRTNLTKGTKSIVENKHLFKGYRGTVSELLNVPEQYVKAVETVLTAALQNIVVDTPEVAVHAVEFLKKNHAGRATFIPLSSIKPRFMREDHLIVAQTQEGFLGILSDLIKVGREFDTLKKFLLGNILLAQNIDEANKLSKLLEKRYMVVTLDGDLIRVGGIISGGQVQEATNTFALDEKIKAIESSLPAIEQKINELTSIYEEYSLKSENISQTRIELSVQSAKLGQQIQDETRKFDSLRDEIESITNEKITLEENIDFTETITSISAKREQVEQLLTIKIKERQDVQADLNTHIKEKEEIEFEFKRVYAAREQYMKTQYNAENTIANAKERLSKEYELMFETAKELYYNPDIDYAGAKLVVDELRAEIKSLGHINIESIEQLKDVQSRYDDIIANQSELKNAKDTIEQAIAEMDKIIIERIRTTVNLVNTEFKYVFNKMFGGGMAEIRYTNPDDLLETGLDIIAQPPGKAIKNLKLFSGGEKALIAISLLFSIIKAKPLPLCILDEVEAALDEANVIRFAEFLHKLKVDTQFIVITHRQGTMERVDHLYGATMQNRGVTTFFSVELSKAKELVEQQ
ncbi:AAA family ATPase [Mycoplasma phocoenae]|uniref:Chromosome partition protein Smc n=1 Tax=Mycoplasma phocoenae TaxID=754517 RepID=A0A858U5A0_9MOLU|nr:AAA family ATPase [Mycoplasma phocoenae]QJG67239.1 AAA family ATPase [Mycoplasma phocoenae]